MWALFAAGLVGASTATAAFPGRDGLLAVQPLTGAGIVLVGADGRHERRLCAARADPCALPGIGLVRPRWAPDGRTLVVDETEGSSGVGPSEVIYPDGSCLECLDFFLSGWSDAAFTGNPTLLTAVTPIVSGAMTRNALVEYGVDGLKRNVLLRGPISGPVWSSRSELALVRGGWIWVGSAAKLRRLTRGSAPSWSPHGTQIVFVRGGWLMTGAVRGRSFRRLVRGAAPAWSPDGRWIAFFDQHHRLSVVPSTGGSVRRVRRVGTVAGWGVDWQPLPAKAPAPCRTPPGSTLQASSAAATLTVDVGAAPFYPYTRGSAYMGCYRASGRERLLSTSVTPGYATGMVTETAVAGPYAALAGSGSNTHDQTAGSGVDVFDLRTGLRVSGRGGEESMCEIQSSPPCTTSIDQLVLGSDAVSAAHTTLRDATCGPIQPQPACRKTIEQIQATDGTGTLILDSVTEPDGSPPALTHLALAGDTLTWQHSGSQRTAQLRP